ncbi:MAG: hypothetical protein J0M04_21195 [Verrucomicrobia bacterium]|nr:hypothetical protein [Verrucomicrobiota bacterium]
MQRLNAFLILVALSCCLTSCGFWNPDPADRLGSAIEREARALKQSEDTSTSFDFVPDAKRASQSPRFTGNIVVRVTPDASTGDSGHSLIAISEWFWTTGHSRFVRVPKELKATKTADEPFHIVLQKRGDEIFWTGLR